METPPCCWDFRRKAHCFSSYSSAASSFHGSISIGLRFVKQTRPPCICLLCGFCSSDRDFAAGFFQIPPHDGHPCLSLTVPTDKPVSVFHRLVNAHAAHTTQSPLARFNPARGYSLLRFCSIFVHNGKQRAQSFSKW